MPWTDEDEALARRIREALGRTLEEKKMFGGLCFLDRGNMVLGVSKGRLMARVGPVVHDEAVTRPGAAPFDFGGRVSRGMLFVTGEGLDDLERWVSDSLAFVDTLPAKPATEKKPRGKKRSNQR